MEKIISAVVRTPAESKREVLNSLDELSRLAETAGGTVVHRIIQTRNKFDPAFLIGRGKLQEIARLAFSENIRTILFDNNLSPAQKRNIEDVIEAKIIDRTRIILDIFAMRAKTKEASLQIELAQLNYYITHLTQKGIFLDNQVGGIGTRGPGERKLEYDRRRIRDKISYLKKEIEEIKKHREIQRTKRKESAIPVIAIAGYTNTGKSTLMNLLVTETMKYQKNSVYADDKLFATLDSTTRRIKLPGGKIALLTDTVGFIRKLPHELIASFRSTLEEITSADLILHLSDISSPDLEYTDGVVLRTFEELGVGSIPVIKVYNKIDLLPKGISHIRRTADGESDEIYISAKTGGGIDGLLRRIEHNLTLLT
ncbi:MAG: GTPase HflX [Elusimicrobiota bacterium]